MSSDGELSSNRLLIGWFIDSPKEKLSDVIFQTSWEEALGKGCGGCLSIRCCGM